MSVRAGQHVVRVLAREQRSAHLVRLRLGGPGLATFATTGVPDEWVAVVVPGQFQSRYYTVRSASPEQVVLDVVVHDEGLVTEWVARDCVAEEVTISDARGSFDPPPDAGWVMLVGDLTAMPAIARICEQTTLPVAVWAESADDLTGYLPDGVEVTWSAPPAPGASALAAVVESLTWPEGPGYFWMAGESGQMRAVRRHLMRERSLPSTSYDVMGYWRGGTTRQPRRVDPGPVWRAGKAAGKTDEEIWADFDAARHEAPNGPQDGARDV